MRNIIGELKGEKVLVVILLVGTMASYLGQEIAKEFADVHEYQSQCVAPGQP